MAFTLPTFNLAFNLWRPGNPTWNAPDVSGTCNLALGRRIGADIPIDFYAPTQRGVMWGLFPPGTDVRDSKASAGGDTVEIPAGSQRMYKVVWVDDAGGGFPNEHRFAVLDALTGWPTPFPKCVGPYPPPPGPPIAFNNRQGGAWPAGIPSVTIMPFAGSDAYVMIIWQNPALTPLLAGAGPVSGPVILAGPPSVGVALFTYTGVGAGVTKALSWSGGAPPSVQVWYHVISVLATVSSIQHDTIVNAGGTATHTPSGWVGPPSNPTYELPYVAWFTDNGSPISYAAPYSNFTNGNTAAVFGTLIGYSFGITQVSSLTYPTWTMTGQTPTQWAGGTVLVG